ncbi:glutathione S-transferase T3-like [Spinacia oleracea]|uniref:Glutathione S-transferase T3-like n=1 Tax=Spinacia oleracea TaxID=3562 RepID=A0A9R0I013_SPIOL|nr:glutathione S-transferase T3-like [Spinacia oleracea]
MMKDEDEDEVQVQNTEVIKGKKGNQKKGRWCAEEEKHLVSTYINCSGDPEQGIDRKKGALWNKIKYSYDAAVVKNPMKSLTMRWGQINEGVTSWIAALGLAERLQASGEVINELEAKAHELYRQKMEDGQPFTFHHCWLRMQHLPRWMPGRDSTIVSEGSSKRSSDEDGMPKRPVGSGEESESPEVIERCYN